MRILLNGRRSLKTAAIYTGTAQKRVLSMRKITEETPRV
jgi:hypothetical protein